MRAQFSVHGIADAQFFNDAGIAQSTLQQVLHGFGMTGQLELIESRGVLEQSCSRSELFAEIKNTLAKGEMAAQLDEANQVTALSAAMTVEQVLMRVDVEGGMGFLMQWTEADKLRASSNGMTGPVVPLEVLQQREVPFEPFQILAHGAHVAPRHRLRRLGSKSQARMVGRRKFMGSQRRRGQKICRKGKRVGQDKRKESHWSCSPRASQSAMTRRVRRKKEKAGCEESRLRNQRRRVEGSGMRSGSLKGGAAFSSDLCSRKYSRSAWLRASKLNWV